MAGIIGVGLAILVGLVLLGLLAFEIKYRQRPGNRLEVTAGSWNLPVYESDHYLLMGEIDIINQTKTLEIFVPELWAEVTLLSKGSLDGITKDVRVTPRHPDAPARPDGYWFGYIVKRKPTKAEIAIDLRGKDLTDLQSAWVRVHYITYGPQGRIPKVKHIIVPLSFPSADAPIRWRPTNRADVLPVRTHLLTHLDDPVEIVKRYVMPHAKDGDVVTIGETPVALMQGRFRHPTEIKPGWVARRICYFFMPTSSLATACGMQSLVDVVGPWRVLFAFIGGSIAKAVFKKPGMFYQWAGEQARLIDDVTGTLPPYDQFIVLGPDQPQQVVDRIYQETGLQAAIVDVNDLKAVKILAMTAGLSSDLLNQALLHNPAGNADEQTPIVLIRPTG
nr:F420-0:Gamma-glutamyl ligase [Leptolyngbya ohadii]